MTGREVLRRSATCMRLRTKVLGILLCFFLVCVYQWVALCFYLANFHPGEGAAHRPELDRKTELGMQMGEPFTVPMTWLFKGARQLTGGDGLVDGFLLWIILILGWLLMSLAYGAAVFGTGCFLRWLVRPLWVRERDASGDWD